MLEPFAELAAASALTNQCRGAGQLEICLRENDLSREGWLNRRLGSVTCAIWVSRA